MPERGVGITPVEVLKWIEEKTGYELTIDGCASDGHERLQRHITPDEDFIKTPRDFTGEVVWLNPPYVGRRRGEYSTADFVARAREIRGRFKCPVIMLLEANMVGTKYFGDHVGHTPADRLAHGTDVFFYPGRINFDNFSGTNKKSSVIVVFHPTSARVRAIP